MSRGLISTAFILVTALVLVSAYIRLSNVGLGCQDWPACYGRIGSAEQGQMSRTERTSSYENLLIGSQEPLAWATPAHRLIASILGLLIFAINIQAFIYRKQGVSLTIPVILLGLTVFLALLGISSGGLHKPSIVLGNLLGGFAMLVLLWKLRLTTNHQAQPLSAPQTNPQHQWISRGVKLGIALLIAQVILGGLTSANFAALACTSFPDCNGTWWPTSEVQKALDIFRVMDTDEAGVFIGGGEQIAIHITHRLGAWLLLFYLGGLAYIVIKMNRIYRMTGIIILVLLTTEILIGTLNVLTHMQLLSTVAHNGVAAFLLLSLISLHHKINTSPAG
ncbi:MAG: COX15/CtaA family protein [Gammaproteobacteria bacterium]|nr:COX15/CtaA family protein [Gammaproteobacteria bacterium]